MRDMLTLLKILREFTPKLRSAYGCIGLCEILRILGDPHNSKWNKINYLEARKVNAFMELNRPPRVYEFTPFWWKEEDLISRLDFIDELIADIKKYGAL